MKKTLTILILAASLGASQVSAIGLGVYGGLNSANLSLDDAQTEELDRNESTTKAKSSLALGAYFNFGLGPIPFLSIQPEVFYTNKGQTWSSSNGDGTFNYNYIEVPLLLKFKVPLIVFNIYAQGGISFSYLSGTGASSDLAELAEELQDELDDHEFQKLNTNYIIGGGISFDIAVLFQIFAEVRYSASLSNTIKDPASDEFIKHQNLYFLLGVGIDI